MAKKKENPVMEETFGKEETYLKIADTIRGEIKNGTLAVGSRLQSEGKLVELFQSNVYSVRKAVGILKEEGLLYSVPKFGVYVSDGKPSEAIHPIDSYVTPSMQISLATFSKLPEQQAFWNRFSEHCSAKSPFFELSLRYSSQNELLSENADLFEFGSFYAEHYSHAADFLNVKDYFSGALQSDTILQNHYGILFSYAVPVLFYNVELLERLGFGIPSYRNYQEQILYFEAVTEAAAKDRFLKVPATAQAAILRLGNHLKEIFLQIKNNQLNEKIFVERYRDIFLDITSYWKKYLISYPRQAEAGFNDFLAGRSPFFFGMNSMLHDLKRFPADFTNGCAMMYSVDETFCRIPVMMALNAKTHHPVECLRVVREIQGDVFQRQLAESGALPMRERDYEFLPYDLHIPASHAGDPLFFHTPEEYYLCKNIFNVELWNIILFEKTVEEAMRDSLMFASSYLNMKLDQMSLDHQNRWANFYN